MIDATQIVRAAQDSFQWCKRHRWQVLIGVVILLFVRRWISGDGAPTVAVTLADKENAAWLARKPLPKDAILSKLGPQDALRECQRIFMGEMAKFIEWELLDVQNPFTTNTARGPTVVVGLVYKTKHAMMNKKWIVWEQTWFFRDGKLIADFDTSEFGKQGAIVWCFQQEEIHKVYGNDTHSILESELPADRKASMDRFDEELRERFRRTKAVTDEALRNMGIEPTQPLSAP